jgi:hypothetical protein
MRINGHGKHANLLRYRLLARVFGEVFGQGWSNNFNLLAAHLAKTPKPALLTPIFGEVIETDHWLAPA